jgi:RNA polymerase sigma-70 factor (ECF subfamily)
MSTHSLESELLISIKNGNLEAYTAFYKSYYKKVFVFVLFLSKDKDLAEDLAQETFARLWENRAKLNEEFALKGFVRRIAKNLVNDHFRKKAVRKASQNTALTIEQTAAPFTMETVYFNELNSLIGKAMDQLPEKKRLIFRLSKYEQLSYKEIAERLKTTPKAIERHMARSTKMVRKYLEEQAGYILPYFVIWYYCSVSYISF